MMSVGKEKNYGTKSKRTNNFPAKVGQKIRKMTVAIIKWIKNIVRTKKTIIRRCWAGPVSVSEHSIIKLIFIYLFYLLKTISFMEKINCTFIYITMYE